MMTKYEMPELTHKVINSLAKDNKRITLWWIKDKGFVVDYFDTNLLEGFKKTYKQEKRAVRLFNSLMVEKMNYCIF